MGTRIPLQTTTLQHQRDLQNQGPMEVTMTPHPGEKLVGVLRVTHPQLQGCSPPAGCHIDVRSGPDT